MKTTVKRILTAAFALVLLCMAAPTFSDNKITPVTGTETVFLQSATGETIVWLDLASAERDFTVKRSGVKVTPGETGAYMINFCKYYTIDGSDEESDYSKTGEWEPYSEESTRCNYCIGLAIEHPGTAKISYKIGTKTYKRTLIVKAYTNPVSSITLTGVYKGKNFASKCKNKLPDQPKLSFPSTVSGATLKVKPKSGWLICNAYLEDETVGRSYSIDSFNDPLSSVSLKVGKLDPTHSIYIDIDFVNAATGAHLDWYFRIGTIIDD